MSNLLKQLKEMTQPKKLFKIGKIISIQGEFYVIKDAAQSTIKATGTGYLIGQTVLVEDNKIIARLNNTGSQVFIDV